MNVVCLCDWKRVVFQFPSFCLEQTEGVIGYFQSSSLMAQQLLSDSICILMKVFLYPCFVVHGCLQFVFFCLQKIFCLSLFVNAYCILLENLFFRVQEQLCSIILFWGFGISREVADWLNRLFFLSCLYIPNFYCIYVIFSRFLSGCPREERLGNQGVLCRGVILQQNDFCQDIYCRQCLKLQLVLVSYSFTKFFEAHFSMEFLCAIANVNRNIKSAEITLFIAFIFLKSCILAFHGCLS